MPPDDTSILRQQSESYGNYSVRWWVRPRGDQPVEAGGAGTNPIVLSLLTRGEADLVRTLLFKNGATRVDILAGPVEMGEGTWYIDLLPEIVLSSDCPCASHPDGGHYPSCPITLAANSAAPGQKRESGGDRG